MRQIAEILKDYQNGVNLSDAELDALAAHLETLALYGIAAGDYFAPQSAYAANVARSCRAFLRARKERAKRWKHI